MNEILKLSDIPPPEPDEVCGVMTGSIHAGVGLRFWGPFDNKELAQEFIDEISPDVSADWFYLEAPPMFEEPAPAVGKKIIDKGTLIEFPASASIFNEKGRLIGVQGELASEL